MSASTSYLYATPRRIARLLPALVLVALVVAVPHPARAQATRTWVSGVGDDANPCSRTAPCKTFAGAISKTAAKGEINVLDPGGFGGVTINKSLTINGCNSEAGVLVSGTNAIVVNAAATDSVVLRCLDINGLGNSLDGIRVVSARSVKITDVEIQGFARNAVDLVSSTNGMKVLVSRSFLHDNAGNGVMVTPPNGVFTKVTLRNNEITDNTCAVVAAQFSNDPGFNFASNCGTSSNASGVNAVVTMNSFNNLISENSVGVFSRGVQAINRIGLNEISNNTTALQSVDTGQILSFGNNLLAGNVTNGAPTGPNIPPLRPER